MGRPVWTLNEGWVTIWREVGGTKNGDSLLTARFVRGITLIERLTYVRKKQPGVSYETPVVDGTQHAFRLNKAYLSKVETDKVIVPSYLYWIEVSWENEEQLVADEMETLKHCQFVGVSKQGDDDGGEMREEIEYDVGEID